MWLLRSALASATGATANGDEEEAPSRSALAPATGVTAGVDQQAPSKVKPSQGYDQQADPLALQYNSNSCDVGPSCSVVGVRHEKPPDSDDESLDSMDVFVGTRKMPEPERLNRLLEIQTPFNDDGREVFQSMVEFMQETFDVPIALVSLVYEEFQWFKACVGLEDARQTPRSASFCAYTFEPLRPEVLCVTDALQDVRFRENVLVTGWPHIRFYCGAPLITHDNVRLGSLCIIDSKPRTATCQEMTILVNLAEVCVRQIVKTELGNKAWQNPPTQLTPPATDAWRQGKIRQAWFNRVIEQCVAVVDGETSNWKIIWSNANWKRSFKVEVEGVWGCLAPLHGLKGENVQLMTSKALSTELSASFPAQATALQDEARPIYYCSMSNAASASGHTISPTVVRECQVFSGSPLPLDVHKRRQLLILTASLAPDC